MTSNEAYYTLSLHLKAGLGDDQTGLFLDAFEGDSLSCSCKKDKGAWAFLWTFPFSPDEEEIHARLVDVAQTLGLAEELVSDFTIEALEDRDWLAESYRALPPFTVGPFFIYGSHYEGATPKGQIPLLIEAATAFGSGEHGTTSRCLLAIDHVRQSGFQPYNILDMGCGSGILAAAAARLWPDVPVFAADNDPECVIVTNRHMAVNGITTVEAFQSEGYEEQSPVWHHAPYDFIIANILAAPLIEMAAEHSRALTDGGYLVLSGMLQEQAERVEAAYAAHGLRLVKGFAGDEWMCLLLKKDGLSLL